MNRRQLLIGLAVLAVSMTGQAQAQNSGDLAKKLLEAASPLGDRILGKSDAPVVMIEYASATCPHCA